MRAEQMARQVKGVRDGVSDLRIQAASRGPGVVVGRGGLRSMGRNRG